MELLKATTARTPEVLLSHANAALTPRHRLRLARAVVEDGWSISYAAAVFNVAWPTAKRWADRYRADGPAGMVDRSSRPHSSPRRTPRPVVRQIVHLRWKQRLGPVAIAAQVGLAPSTVHRILVACRINRRWHVDRVTGEPIRRIRLSRPGELVHVDIKKLGNIPDGGGWRKLGRAQGGRNSHAHRDPARPRKRGTGGGHPNLGYCYVHSAIDGHTRPAYSEALDDETAATALAF